MLYHMRSLSKQAYILPVLSAVLGKMERQEVNKDILPNATYILDDEDPNVVKFLKKKMLFKVAPAVNVAEEVVVVKEKEQTDHSKKNNKTKK